MTVSQIAKLAKVSTATVSRTINRVPTVDPVLARRVWRVIEEVGYFPNTHARTLVNGRSRIFGLIVSETASSCFPNMVQRFADMGVEHGYEILFTSLPRDPHNLELTIRRLIERRVDGVAILTFEPQSQLMNIFERNGVHAFALETDFPGPFSHTARIDYKHGIRHAVQHLAALGHQRIAFVGGPPESQSAATRKSVFEECMKEIHLEIPAELAISADYTVAAGANAMSALAGLPESPSAVICASDMTAIGLMREASERGFDIPQDLSVIGMDDISFAHLVSPSLTTVQVPQIEIANIAFKALSDSAEARRPVSSYEQQIVKTNLVLRRSTAIAPDRQKINAASQLNSVIKENESLTSCL